MKAEVIVSLPNTPTVIDLETYGCDANIKWSDLSDMAQFDIAIDLRDALF